MTAARKRRKGHRSHGRGTLMIDRRFKGVGRLKRASGTTDAEVFKLFQGMLDSLAAAGRLDILKSLKAGTVTFAEVWDIARPQSDRPASLNALPSPETARRLWRTVKGAEAGALERFIAAHDVSDTHRANLRRDARALRTVARTDATVAELPALVKAFRAVCVREQKARTFNMTRTTAQAFLRETVGQFHPLYGAVTMLKPMAETRKAGRPLTPDELREFCDRLRATFGRNGAAYAEAFYGMAVTGMRPVEFWGGEWHQQPDRVRIRGAKQKGGRIVHREVPLVAPIQPPEVAFATFRDQLWKRGITEHTAYDARRTFAVAMEAAGIPRTRRVAYMGHGASDMTALYERHEVAAYLADDGAKLRAYFGVTAPGALGLVQGRATA